MLVNTLSSVLLLSTFAAADPSLNPTKTSRISSRDDIGCNMVPNPETTSQCNVHGHIRLPKVLNRFQSESSDENACRDACFQNSGCVAFSYNSRNNYCRQLGKILEKQSFREGKSAVHFWNKDCFKCDGNGGNTDPDPIVTPPPDVAFPDYTPPNTDDPSWTRTYTYEEYPLYTDTPDSGIDLGIPTSAADQGCFVDPKDSSQEFIIINNHGIPLVNVDNTLRPPANSDYSEDFQPPTFNFEQASISDSLIEAFIPNRYDLIINDQEGPLYVAWRKDTDAMILIDRSSQGSPMTVNINGNDVQVQTTLFKVDCDGTLLMTATDFPLNLPIPAPKDLYWLIGDTISYASTSPPGNGDKIMLLPQAAIEQDLKKRNIYTDGPQPRCANNPPGLLAQVRSGARNPRANGCGSADSGFDYVPDWDFGGCCDQHDYCYDDCSNGFFTPCNDKFGACMHKVCADYPWYEQPFVRWPCDKMASFYQWSVQTFGTGAFKSANDQRCECVCPNRNEKLCSNTGSGSQCVNLKASNNKNCGACGRTCGIGSSCAGDSCQCSKDTCDGLCLDTRNHPKHCGSCGHVCDSGYCVSGQCVTPKQDVCFPKSAVTNGDFDDGLNGWDVYQRDGTPQPAFDDGYAFVGFYKVDNYGDWTVSFGQDVAMCSRTNYELSFKAVSYWFDDSGKRPVCTVSAKLGCNLVVLPFEVYLPGSFSDPPNTYPVGPVAVSLDDGDSCTWKDGLYTKANLRMTVTCRGAGNSGVMFRNIEIYAVQ